MSLIPSGELKVVGYLEISDVGYRCINESNSLRGVESFQEQVVP